MRMCIVLFLCKFVLSAVTVLFLISKVNSIQKFQSVIIAAQWYIPKFLNTWRDSAINYCQLIENKIVSK